MTVEKEKTSPPPSDKFGKAGYEAEKQMAFYLQREFGESDAAFVFNDLRIVRNGEVAQIDHLILHQFGMVLIESKSVTGAVEVNSQLEFVRVFGRKRTGMKSPLVQVDMQRQLLQKLLIDHKDQLRQKAILGLVQASFSDDRFKCFVAISDRGEIKRRGCNPKQLVKADRAATEISKIIHRHSRMSGFGGFLRHILADEKLAKEQEKDTLSAFSAQEVEAIKQFLLARHQEPAPVTVELNAIPPRQSSTGPPVHRETAASPRTQSIPSTVVPPPPTCKDCYSMQLEIVHGKYGYYFKCKSCTRNTAIDFTCPRCGAKARIRKAGFEFTRQCESCDDRSHFYTNPPSADVSSDVRV